MLICNFCETQFPERYNSCPKCSTNSFRKLGVKKINQENISNIHQTIIEKLNEDFLQQCTHMNAFVEAGDTKFDF